MRNKDKIHEIGRNYDSEKHSKFDALFGYLVETCDVLYSPLPILNFESKEIMGESTNYYIEGGVRVQTIWIKDRGLKLILKGKDLQFVLEKLNELEEVLTEEPALF